MNEIINRLRSVEGQVRGIQRMIEADRCCDDILAQVAAARSALQSVATQTVRARVEDLFQECAKSKSRDTAQMVDELMTIVTKHQG